MTHSIQGKKFAISMFAMIVSVLTLLQVFHGRKANAFSLLEKDAKVHARVEALERAVTDLSCDLKTAQIANAFSVCSSRCETVYVGAELEELRRSVVDTPSWAPAAPISSKTPAEQKSECQRKCSDQFGANKDDLPEVCK